jgi:hypothetical protein
MPRSRDANLRFRGYTSTEWTNGNPQTAIRRNMFETGAYVVDAFPLYVRDLKDGIANSNVVSQIGADR